MDTNSQADGFFGGMAQCNHPECSQLDECCHPLAPNENSGRGKHFEQTHDVARQLQYPMQYRLRRGFAILSGGKHSL
jgi:hypothetical protein